MTKARFTRTLKTGCVGPDVEKTHVLAVSHARRASRVAMAALAR